MLPVAAARLYVESVRRSRGPANLPYVARTIELTARSLLRRALLDQELRLAEVDERVGCTFRASNAVRHQWVARNTYLVEQLDSSEPGQLEALARRECRRYVAAINELQQRAAGVGRYRWITCRDSRVSPVHAALAGRTFLWDRPHAVVGHPGRRRFCRCYAAPVV